MVSRNIIKDHSLLFSNLLQILLLLHGIDIKKTENKRLSTTLKRFLVFFSFTICHLAFLVSFKDMVEVLALIEDKSVIKNLLALNFAAVNSLIMWYSLYFKRHELLELLSKVSRISDRLKARPPVRLPKLCITYIFFSLLLAALITAHRVYTFMAFTDYFNKGIAWVFNSSMSFFVVTFYQTIFCCFYISLCSALHSFLKNLLRSVNHSIPYMTPLLAKTINGRYRETLNTLLKAEEILSRLAFFMLLTTFIFIFFGFYFCLIAGKLPSPIVLFAFSQSLINFLMLFYFTIRVHEMDKKMKEILKNFVERPELLRLCEGYVESFKLKIYEKPFSFSAWGFFKFTKGFFVGALGSGLTYMLLVTQL